MAIKNPNNLITLDDDITENVAVNGQYYPDTRVRYREFPESVVRCDRCGKCPLACCVGLDTTDLCLECVELARTRTLTVKDLEHSVGITDTAEGPTVHSSNAFDPNSDQIQPNLTEEELHTQYYLSDIQRAQIETLYECLAEHKTNSFRLTSEESNELMSIMYLISKFNAIRKWSSPEDRMIHPPVYS